MSRTFRRPLGAIFALGILVAIASCGSEPESVEVTDAMKAEALRTIESGEMPNVQNWEMDETDRGVRYVELTPGSGENAWFNDDVIVHYYLWLTDGTLVDSSRPEGVVTPFDFTVGEGRVIQGWDEIIREMNEGSEVVAIVPWELGYGRNGRRGVPGKADLVFYIRLVRIS